MRKLALLSVAFALVAVSFYGCDETLTLTPTEPTSEPLASVESASGSNEFLKLTVNEGLGESQGSVDVKRVRMWFSTVTGEYVIVLQAGKDAPFVGQFRVDIKLYNHALGPAQSPSFFTDTENDYDYSEPEMTLVLTGTNPRLTAWQQGQFVYTNNMRGTPGPDGVFQYRTAVYDLPIVGIGGEWIGHKGLTTPVRIRGAGGFPK